MPLDGNSLVDRQLLPSEPMTANRRLRLGPLVRAGRSIPQWRGSRRNTTASWRRRQREMLLGFGRRGAVRNLAPRWASWRVDRSVVRLRGKRRKESRARRLRRQLSRSPDFALTDLAQRRRGQPGQHQHRSRDEQSAAPEPGSAIPSRRQIHRMGGSDGRCKFERLSWETASMASGNPSSRRPRR